LYNSFFISPGQINTQKITYNNTTRRLLRRLYAMTSGFATHSFKDFCLIQKNGAVKKRSTKNVVNIIGAVNTFKNVSKNFFIIILSLKLGM